TGDRGAVGIEPDESAGEVVDGGNRSTRTGLVDRAIVETDQAAGGRVRAAGYRAGRERESDRSARVVHADESAQRTGLEDIAARGAGDHAGRAGQDDRAEIESDQAAGAAAA